MQDVFGGDEEEEEEDVDAEVDLEGDLICVIEELDNIREEYSK